MLCNYFINYAVYVLHSLFFYVLFFFWTFPCKMHLFHSYFCCFWSICDTNLLKQVVSECIDISLCLELKLYLFLCINLLLSREVCGGMCLAGLQWSILWFCSWLFHRCDSCSHKYTMQTYMHYKCLWEWDEEIDFGLISVFHSKYGAGVWARNKDWRQTASLAQSGKIQLQNLQHWIQIF